MDDLDTDLQNDFYFAKAVDDSAAATRRLNKIENRLERLENELQATREECGETAHVLAQVREQYARNAMGEAEQGAQTLAKAQSSAMRRTTPAGLLERGQRVLDDPTQFGMLESYVQGGKLIKAAEMLEAAEQKADQDDADAARVRVESQIAEHTQLASLSKLGEKVGALEHTLNQLLSRLNRLERPQPARAETVAKAVGAGGKRRPRTDDYADTPAGLAARADGVIDSPARVGYLNSLLQSGDPAQIEQARQAIVAAELAHESDVKKRDRRGL